MITDELIIALIWQGEELAELELQRRRNIERNQELLRQLGLA